MPEHFQQLIRLDAVLHRTALSRTRVYELVRTGRFPRPLKLAGSRTNAWVASEVDDWIVHQIRNAKRT